MFVRCALRVLFLLSSVHNCFHDLECARPRTLRDIKKQFICRTNLGATGDPQNVILENELLRRHALVVFEIQKRRKW